MSKIIGLLILFALYTGGCTGSPRPAGPEQAGRSNDKNGEPAWVASPESVYNRNQYIAALGYGGDRSSAEKNAFIALASIFGQAIKGEQLTVTNYSQAVLNGAVSSWRENTELANAIKTSVALGTLVGAEIGGYWYDGKSVHYAVAVMDRARTVILYADMMRSNQRIIDKLVTISGDEKNSFNGYARYRLAGTVADANQVFANVLSVAEGTGISSANMKKGDEYRVEAAAIAKVISIAVAVEGDASRRIENAFARVLNEAGFPGGENTSRYRMDAELILDPVDLPNQQNKFVRYTVNAALKDIQNGDIFLPFSVNGREGHRTEAEARNRALAAAEKRINEEYKKLLQDYLSALLPYEKEIF
jgi:hypothetical protein